MTDAEECGPCPWEHAAIRAALDEAYAALFAKVAPKAGRIR